MKKFFKRFKKSNKKEPYKFPPEAEEKVARLKALGVNVELIPPDAKPSDYPFMIFPRSKYSIGKKPSCIERFKHLEDEIYDDDDDDIFASK